MISSEHFFFIYAIHLIQNYVLVQLQSITKMLVVNLNYSLIYYERYFLYL